MSMLNEVEMGVTQQTGAQQAAAAQGNAAQAQVSASLAKVSADLAAKLARDQTQLRNAIQDANDAVNSVQPPVPPVPPVAPLPPGGSPTIVIPTDGGDNITINVDGSGIHVSQNGHEAVIPIRDVVPRGAVLMTYAVCASFAFIIVGWPVARAFARWLDRRGASNRISADVQGRLDAMDRNIDTVAVELERVSEGQRFTAKLLAERGQIPAVEYVAAGARVPVQGA